jgi:hypothetical protein
MLPQSIKARAFNKPKHATNFTPTQSKRARRRVVVQYLYPGGPRRSYPTALKSSSTAELAALLPSCSPTATMGRDVRHMMPFICRRLLSVWRWRREREG